MSAGPTTFITVACYTAGKMMRDEWSAHDTEKDALEAYDKALSHPDIYSASVCAVLESTDYPSWNPNKKEEQQ